MYFFLSTLFLIFDTLLHLVNSCPQDLKCKNIGHTREFIASYSPHLEWTYQTDQSKRVKGQASSEKEAVNNMLKDLQKIITTVRIKAGSSIEIQEITFVDIGNNTKVGNYRYVEKPKKCKNWSCLYNKDGTFKKEDGKITKLLKSYTEEKKDLYFMAKGFTYNFNNPKVKEENSGSQIGAQVYLPLRLRVSFKKSKANEKMCSTHWDYIQELVTKEFKDEYRIFFVTRMKPNEKGTIPL
uniref:Uncharacterized protein n=1 Tax=Parastrongyloides trichosuri TaxID=131310 RepID=A0A0N4ZDE7_PARTI